jgi:hypothetical protein
VANDRKDEETATATEYYLYYPSSYRPTGKVGMMCRLMVYGQVRWLARRGQWPNHPQ